MDYLHHPECDASTVADMIHSGKSASEIARFEGIALQGRQSDRVSEYDPESAPTGLSQPPAVLNRDSNAIMKYAGHTFEEIGEHFGVSHELVRKVLRTYSKAKNIPIPPAKEHRWQRKSFRAQAATERIAEHSVQPQQVFGY
jgi:hypothetical protein